jgi:hypothetical protein
MQATLKAIVEELLCQLPNLKMPQEKQQAAHEPELQSTAELLGSQALELDGIWCRTIVWKNSVRECDLKAVNARACLQCARSSGYHTQQGGRR